MAIVIKSSPVDKSSVNNEMLFVVLEAVKASDPVTYIDYKYILSLYINAVLVATLKAVPDPVYFFGVFNVAPILQSFVDYGLNISATVVDYDASVGYNAIITEEYN